ncbi:E-selectin [Synchiropus splendidus]|uniref:E-selectin n=1 Tax=Synchiropus splendidus TaxID=270530 RepID=UPI00237EDEE4|nr:E-selectin [Synchiropus splendidus]
MEFCYSLFHPTASKDSWMCWTIIFSMMSLWTSVDCWSYYYSNETMNWQDARSWCKKSYTDMVAIQNQEEIAHLNKWLPKKDTYYWIGIRKIDNIWTWVGTNKALTPEATNWAQGEPNNAKDKKGSGENEDCVEMYIKRAEQAGKWNDERCTKAKTALCYTAACKDDSCLHGECVETINSHRCECHEGFYGDKCEHVMECNQEDVTAPRNGGVQCAHKHGNYTFDSTCNFSCEKGYELSAPGPLRCTASKTWSAERPACNLVQCSRLPRPLNGSIRCTHPLGPDSYQSTCFFSCNEGYELVGGEPAALQCDESGEWNASAPICAAVQCPALPKLENGITNCDVDGDLRFSFGNACHFSCSSGYKLVGPSSVRCSSSAEWSERMPSCDAITCSLLEEESHLITKCSQPLDNLRPNSICSFTCEDGYDLQGAETTHCSEDGLWTEAKPTCQAVKCPRLEAPEKGHINCSKAEQDFNTQCSFTCDHDHLLEGHELMICDRHGNWTGALPVCKAPSPQIAIVASSVAVGAAASLAVFSLVLWLLKRLRKGATKFELNSNSDIEDPPQVYKNSIDSLI